MSYCRTSSDNWKCDLYCYAHIDGGYMTHVATSKHKQPIPKVDFSLMQKNPEKFSKQYDAQMKAVNKAKLVEIGLPQDGKSFSDPDLKSFLKRIRWLKSLGYNVHNKVFERIKSEMKK